MKDKILFFMTTKYRQVIRVMEKLKIPVKKAYRSYFRFVKSLLKSDFDIVDKLITTNSEFMGGVKDSSDKKIWVMWWQGLDEAPEIVKVNIKRIMRIFGKENVVLITHKNYKKYTDICSVIYKKFEDKKITFISWSDIIRFNLLKNHGGIWIDSTVVLSNKILDENILNKAFFSLCSSGKYQFVSDGRWTGWMIGGDENLALFHYVNKFYEEYFKRHDSIIDYYIVDYVIDHYFSKNESLRKLIESERREWKNSEFMIHLFNIVPEKIISNFEHITEWSVQKITYKKKIPKNLATSALYNLILEDKI